MDSMNDLLKKLNVLVKASLNDRISGGGGSNDLVNRPQMNKRMDDDVQALRQRINEASSAHH